MCGVPESLLSEKGPNQLSYLMTDVAMQSSWNYEIEYYSIPSSV